VPEVQKARWWVARSAYLDIFVCVVTKGWPDWCPACKSDEIALDPETLKKPPNFPNAAKVLADRCGAQKLSVEDGQEVICKDSMPY